MPERPHPFPGWRRDGALYLPYQRQNIIKPENFIDLKIYAIEALKTKMKFLLYGSVIRKSFLGEI